MPVTTSPLDQFSEPTAFATRNASPVKPTDTGAFDREYFEKEFEEPHAAHLTVDSQAIAEETQQTDDAFKNAKSEPLTAGDGETNLTLSFSSSRPKGSFVSFAAQRLFSHGHTAQSAPRDDRTLQSAGDTDLRAASISEALGQARAPSGAEIRSVVSTQAPDVSGLKSAPTIGAPEAEHANINVTGIEGDIVTPDKTGDKSAIYNRSHFSPQVERAAGEQVTAAILRSKDNDRLEIALDPPELGRIRIDFDLQRSGAVKAVIYAENMHTFDLLRRNIDILKNELLERGGDDIDLSMGEQTWSENKNEKREAGERTKAINLIATSTDLDPRSSGLTEKPGRIDRVI